MALTIDQNPERQARAALDILLARFGYAKAMRFPGSPNESRSRSTDRRTSGRRSQ